MTVAQSAVSENHERLGRLARLLPRSLRLSLGGEAGDLLRPESSADQRAFSPGADQGLRPRGIQGARARWAHLRSTVESFEQTYLDPLFDQALERLAGGNRRRRQQALITTLASSTLTPEERAMNRGLYISVTSFALAAAGDFLLPPLRVVSLACLLYNSRAIYAKAYLDLREERRISIDVLTALTNTIYLASGFWLYGSLSQMSFFFSARLLSAIQDRFAQDMTAAFSLQSQMVWQWVQEADLLPGPQASRDGSFSPGRAEDALGHGESGGRGQQAPRGHAVQVPLETIQVGDVVVVQAGEVIPVDGVVKYGSGLVDQQVLTGEARPVEKSAGDRESAESQVFAMTLVVSGRLYVAVTQTSQETTAARVGRLLQETQDPRATQRLQSFALTERLIAPVLGLSALSLPLLGPLQAASLINIHPRRHLINLSMLSNLSFLLYATHRDVLIKDGRSLEILKKVDTIVFDKTGTLTQPQPQVSAFHLCAESEEGESEEGGIEETDMLRYAAAAEQRQSHPIAKALLAEAAARNLDLPTVEDATYQVGFGLAVQMTNSAHTADAANSGVTHTVHVGSARFMQMEDIHIPAAIQRVQEACRLAGHSLVFVAVDGRLQGAIELQIQARDEAAEVIAALKSGYGGQRGGNRQGETRHIVLVSGDQAAPTAALAHALGIDEYVAEALPSDKAALIAELQASGRSVCFVGDGINDAVALKQADLSISLYGATAAATETAHIVLMRNDLRQMLSLFEMADEYAVNQRRLTRAMLSPGVLGAFGVLFLGFSLPEMTLLSMLNTTLGTTVAMQPWLRQHRLVQSADPDDAVGPTDE